MKQKRDYSKIKKLFAVVFVIISAMVGVYISEKKDSSQIAATAARNIINVMILGVDKRADDLGRSDTLMIVSYDETSGEAKLLSIPRDTRVKLSTGNYEKINHAYAYGGVDGSKKAVENLLDIKIDHYVLLDTKAFPKIIDAMGGLLLYVDKRMYYEDPWDDDGLVIDLYPGEQYLDGNRAIQYVRFRDDEGDIGRIKRQQKFVKAVLNELMSAETLPKLPEILKIAANSVETDFSTTEIISFADNIRKVYQAGLNAETLKGRPAYYKGVSYYVPNLETIRADFRKSLKLPVTEDFLRLAKADNEKYESDIPEGMKFDEAPLEDASLSDGNIKELTAGDIEVTVLNCSGKEGMGKRTADILEARGFKVVFVGNGEMFDKSRTTFEVPEGSGEIFANLPFDYTIIESDKKKEAVLNIGLDYNLKEE